MTGAGEPRAGTESSAASLLQELTSFAGLSRILVAIDFDGTLAPLVDDPMSARALPGSLEVLSELARVPDTIVALVSGRALADLIELTRVAEPVVLIGSHGVERSSDGQGSQEDPEERVRFAALDTALATALRDQPLARIERKPHSLVLHTRGLPPGDAAAAVRSAEEVIARHTGVVVTPGKDVLEMATRHVGKGIALRELATEHDVEALLYVGDDVTDERAFEMLRPTDLTVRVGPGATAARFRIANERAVLRLLRALLALRTAG